MDAVAIFNNCINNNNNNNEKTVKLRTFFFKCFVRIEKKKNKADDIFNFNNNIEMKINFDLFI